MIKIIKVKSKLAKIDIKLNFKILNCIYIFKIKMKVKPMRKIFKIKILGLYESNILLLMINKF